MAIEPGQQLLHYRLIEKIGQRGMGAVWKATDTTFDRSVAIKVLLDAVTADPERVARLEREARLLVQEPVARSCDRTTRRGDQR